MDGSKELRLFARIVFLLMPTIVTTILLIEFFPYTGLGRIVTIPLTLLANIGIVGISMLITYRKKCFVITKVSLTVIITIAITISMYPQDSGRSVVQQVRQAAQAIQQIDHLDRSYLRYDDYRHEAEYVVALYKFRNEIPLDGTYYLYDSENKNAYLHDYVIYHK